MFFDVPSSEVMSPISSDLSGSFTFSEVLSQHVRSSHRLHSPITLSQVISQSVLFRHVPLQFQLNHIVLAHVLSVY